ncbi:orotidine-5'-phosphate decarboxylase [Rothia kristinae]|uniref:orotidine-5'-phosphate decarboxylase n=1 Tax=Rothia kristinae TaxID=37923 RepID=UPI0022E632EA|nr:orotidine-5'-phosphate decarboxylase [Rothia kristinae]
MSAAPETARSPRGGAGDRLVRAMAEHGPLCVGIDPHPGLLRDWGLADDADGARTFGLRVVEAAAGAAAVVKPQVALFERHGSAGLAALEQVLTAAADAGLELIADAKRGDIGSTMAAYADAWLREGSPLAADWVTLSPYLGFGSLDPALNLAAETGRGAFVLALTSNPEGASVQHVGGPEASVARGIVAAARELNERLREPGPEGAGGWELAGPCGLVVGATVGAALTRLGIDLADFPGPILAPGYGAQGATEEDLARVFAGASQRLVVSSSRAILRHGPRAEELREEILRTNRRLIAGLAGS